MKIKALSSSAVLWTSLNLCIYNMWSIVVMIYNSYDHVLDLIYLDHTVGMITKAEEIKKKKITMGKSDSLMAGVGVLVEVTSRGREKPAVRKGIGLKVRNCLHHGRMRPSVLPWGLQLSPSVKHRVLYLPDNSNNCAEAVSHGRRKDFWIIFFSLNHITHFIHLGHRLEGG